MKPGIALLAVNTSVTVFLCLSALGAVDASGSDFLLSVENESFQAHRHLLSMTYKTVNRDSEPALRAIATVDTTVAMSTAAAATGSICSKCQWQ